MKPIKFTLFAAFAMLVASCAGPRYASTTEYDDVYYSKSDKTEAVVRESAQPADDYTYQRTTRVDDYTDAYYDEDDFYFSRRLRRFNQPATGNWRYYDPFYSNDLYFVLGTPAWNTWNSYGWYNWNNPRFGAFSPYNSFAFGYDPFFRANPFYRNSFNYYNPWVGSYYGYGAGFGGFYGRSFGGFGGGFGGFGGAGFGSSAYYCPPIAGGGFFNRLAGNNRNNNTIFNSRRRGTTSSSTSNTTYNPRVSRNASTRTTSSNGTVRRPGRSTSRTTASSTTAGGTDYLSPRSNTATSRTNGRSVNRNRTTTGTRTYTSPSSRNGVNNQELIPQLKPKLRLMMVGDWSNPP